MSNDPLAQFLPPGTTAEQMQALALKFESLGGHWLGCEVGQIQRLWRAEPIGLLRWSAMMPENLLAALTSRFDGVGDPDNTLIQERHGTYWTQDRRLFMAMDSFIKTDSVDKKSFEQQATQRLRFLRDKLIGDLTAGEKIFVFKSTARPLSESEVFALSDSMRAYGDNILLCVRPADAFRPLGTVTEFAPGLLVGYIDRFAAGPNGEGLGFNPLGWHRVLQGALELSAHRLPGGQPARANAPP